MSALRVSCRALPRSFGASNGKLINDPDMSENLKPAVNVFPNESRA